MRVFWLALAVTLLTAVNSKGLKLEKVDLFSTLQLDCDVSEYGHLVDQGQINISWEAMGKDVVSYDGSTFRYGPEFANRVSVFWDSSGNFSAVLTPVVLSDSDIFECLVDGKKSLSMVIVTVEKENTEDGLDSVQVDKNVDIMLKCYGKISKSSTLDKVSVYWMKGGQVIYNVIDGIPPNPPSFWYKNRFLDPSRVHTYGDLSLRITNVSDEDAGLYTCSYNNKNFFFEENASVVDVIVRGSLIDEEYPDAIAEPEGPALVTLQASTTETPQPKTFVKSYEDWNTFPPETSNDVIAEEETGPAVPWVLIGIISGVLILTVLILGPLVAMGKI